MKKDKFKADENENKEYCDADILKNFDKDGKLKKGGEEVDLNFTPYEKTKEVDLMDFISKSDFTTVGGKAAPKEEIKQEEFNFADFDNAPPTTDSKDPVFNFLEEKPAE